MTYEELEKANQSIKTTDIKGKEYAEVNQRIKAFRMLYPDGYITTQIVNLEDGVCVIHAEVGYTVTDSEGFPHDHVLGQGTAYEKEGSTFINKTSYIENCETSAVGRALGMCGIGIDTSIASAEEVENAILQQNVGETVIDNTKAQALALNIANAKVDEKRVLGILAKHGYHDVTEIKVKDYMTIVEELKSLKE